MTESCPKKTNIAEISPHLICALCGGYLIDATTIVECLHSFCKTCIVRYLESSKYCPICEVLVHKTRPLQNIRLDHTLQDIVYKLVPNLFKEEMKRRRDFYKDHPTIRSAKVRQEQQRHRFIYSADEQFSISLEFCPDGCIRRPSSRRSRKRSKQEPPERRYFLCPAGTTIGLLKKFMKLKFALDGKYQVDIFHEKGRLKNHYSLMDVAYIYSWKREGVLQLYYSVFNLPEPLPTITITEVKPEKCQEVTDDTGQRLEDTRPSTLFNKATLLGNHSVDRNIPHDLSPLQLIATVASDICIQEGRGIKRKPDESELYEKEEDTNNSTEACQLQKSIERAIDLCSNSNQGSPARAVVTNSVATSSIVVNTSSSVSTTSGVLQSPTGAIQNPSGASLVSTQSVLKSTDMKKTIDVSNGKVSNVLTSSSEKKVNVFKEKPKKTDTASQCDPRPKKHKGDGNHSKSKSHNNNKDNTKATTSVSKSDRIAISETKLSTKSDSSLKSNGVSIIEQTVSSVPTTQNSQSKPSETSGKIPTSVATTTTNITTTKDQAKDLPKASSDSHRESSSVCKVPSTLSSSLPLSASSSVSKSNSSSVRQSGSSSSTKSLTSSSSAKSSNNNSIKTPSSTSSKSSSVQPPKSSVVPPKSSPAQTKSSVTQPKVWSGMSHSQNTQVSNTDKTVGEQITNKVLSYSPKLSATSLPKATNSTSKTNDVVKSSTLVNGHGNTGEISKQQSKNSSSVKVKTSDSKE